MPPASTRWKCSAGINATLTCLEKILAFLAGIGIVVRRGEVAPGGFLPGIRIEAGALVYNPDGVFYPGDLLHEAGHLALMDPARRASANGDIGDDAGEEMGAIAWSYAAALHIGIDPGVVFHPDGYKGGSEAILENFAAGRYLGVPILRWKGLTADGYPHMLRWLSL